MNSEGAKVVFTSLVSLILACEQAARFPSDSCGILSKFIQSLLVGVEQPPDSPPLITSSDSTTTNQMTREESVLDKFNWEPLPVVQDAQTFSENFAEYSDWLVFFP